MASLIDTHAHLDFDRFDEDRGEVIERAFAGGLEAIMTVGTDPASWERTWSICQENDRVYPVLGYHPNDLEGLSEPRWEALVEWLRAHPPVAIGEIGLDYYWDDVPRQTQEDYFRKQLRLALEMSLAVVIHCRDAYADCLRILREECGSSVHGVMHCFSSGPEVAEQAVAMGLCISFAGPLTYKKSDDLREAARTVPLDRLLVETDCPFLAPQIRRGKRNEPAYVRFTAEKLAEIREMSFEQIAEATTANAKNLFNLREEDQDA